MKKEITEKKGELKMALSWDPGPGVAFLIMLILGSFMIVLGVYLIFTNPPKNRRKFLGLGSEKMSKEEVKELQEKQKEKNKKTEEKLEKMRK